jgi:hypothetical protein
MTIQAVFPAKGMKRFSVQNTEYSSERLREAIPWYLYPKGT